MITDIVWFTDDLRLADNSLLLFDSPPEALLCVYVLDVRRLARLPGLEAPRIGSARLRFLWQSLIALRGEMLKRGSDLLVRVGDPLAVVSDLVGETAARQVRVQAPTGSEERDNQAQLLASLPEGCELAVMDSGLLYDEARLPFPLRAMPGSFAAFRRLVDRRAEVPAPHQPPMTLPPWPQGAARGLPPLHRVNAAAARWREDPRGGFRFEGGEASGLARLDHYLWQSGAVANYRQTRNGLLGSLFSTRLSPWLAHGCLSARQVHQAVRGWEAEHGTSASSDWVIVELQWRDYCHWVARREGATLFGARQLPGGGSLFTAWRRGRTGVPFIDAAMKELEATGWLSNRARQNVANFLVKDLGVDWRLGAAWFEHCLVDYDVAANWGNWRYVAGVGRNGREPAFDVLSQAKHYDRQGNYVAHWLPELRNLPPGESRHQPWRVAPEMFPLPLVAVDDGRAALPASDSAESGE